VAKDQWSQKPVRFKQDVRSVMDPKIFTVMAPRILHVVLAPRIRPMANGTTTTMPPLNVWQKRANVVREMPSTLACQITSKMLKMPGNHSR
jgi:hypothetical protein